MNLLSMSTLNYTVENESGGPDTEEPGYEAPEDCEDLAVQYLQGGSIMYAKAGAGEKITQHQNFRPGNPWHEFYDMQARQCLVGACLPASLWKPSGQGTAERADIGKACRFVEDRQAMLDKIGKWRLTKAIAWAMENDRIPKSDDWYNWGFTHPPKLTIDDGRSLKESMALYNMGLKNSTEIAGQMGMDFDEMLDERAHEVLLLEQKILDIEKLSGIKLDKRDFRLVTPNEMPEENIQPTNQPK